MASRTTLKTYFNNGDFPNETQLASLIDSLAHVSEDGLATTADVASGVSLPVVVESTTARTLALTDASKFILCDSSSAVSVTVPPQASVAWAASARLIVQKAGSGNVTIVAGAGVTLNSAAGLVAATQYSFLELFRTASDVWSVSLLPGSGGGGNVATDTIFDAAGDLIQGTGANTAARLALGTALQVLQVNAGATAVEWATANGNVAKVGTPVNNQVGVWTGDGTIEGVAALTFDGTTGLALTKDLVLGETGNSGHIHFADGAGGAGIELDASADLLTIGSVITVLGANISGPLALMGATVVTATAMPALVINVAVPLNTKSIAADSSFAFSSNTPTAGTRTEFKLTVDATDRVATLPAAVTIWSYARNANITTVTIPASSTASLSFEYTGSRWEIYGDPVATTGAGSYVQSTSPTLVTPALGTPSAIVLTNATGTAASLTAGIAQGLKSATTTVSVSAATAPSSGQVLTATSDSLATWQTPSGGGGSVATDTIWNVAGDLAQGTGSDTAARLPIGTANQVLAVNSGATAVEWVTPSGGSGDMLSVLTAAEISITTTATATIGRMHVCTGTTANYTVTLPAVSGNTGKFLGVRMSSALTKLVTLDGDASETIDGALTRVMWANESAILFCDGSTWTKVGGKSIPFYCQLSNDQVGGAQAITTATMTQLDYDEKVDVASLGDLTANTVTIPRPGSWYCAVHINYDAGFTATRVLCRIFKNGSTELFGVETGIDSSSSYPSITDADYVALVAGDTIEGKTYQNSGSSWSLVGNAVGGNTINRLVVKEDLTW